MTAAATTSPCHTRRDADRPPRQVVEKVDRAVDRVDDPLAGRPPTGVPGRTPRPTTPHRGTPPAVAAGSWPRRRGRPRSRRRSDPTSCRTPPTQRARRHRRRCWPTSRAVADAETQPEPERPASACRPSSPPASGASDRRTRRLGFGQHPTAQRSGLAGSDPTRRPLGDRHAGRAARATRSPPWRRCADPCPGWRRAPSAAPPRQRWPAPGCRGPRAPRGDRRRSRSAPPPPPCSQSRGELAQVVVDVGLEPRDVRGSAARLVDEVATTARRRPAARHPGGNERGHLAVLLDVGAAGQSGVRSAAVRHRHRDRVRGEHQPRAARSTSLSPRTAASVPSTNGSTNPRWLKYGPIRSTVQRARRRPRRAPPRCSRDTDGNRCTTSRPR